MCFTNLKGKIYRLVCLSCCFILTQMRCSCDVLFLKQGSAPHIDTSQLDHEIKQIMIQIIPFIKQQMNSICSQQLLHYIQQLTLSLMRLQQLSHRQPQLSISSTSATAAATASLTGSGGVNEFTRFFHRQLDTILRDSLAKFEGRK